MIISTKELCQSSDELFFGVQAAHPNLFADVRYRILTHKKPDSSKVCVILGGSMEDAPFYADIVSKSAVAAAVFGDLSCPPSPIQLYKTLVNAKTNAGALLLTKEEEQNRISFEVAEELATEDGLDVSCVFCKNEGLSQAPASRTAIPDRINLLFVQKIACEAARRGLSLNHVAQLATITCNQVRTALLSPVLFPVSNSNFMPALQGSTNKQIFSLVSGLITSLGVKPGHELMILVNGFGKISFPQLDLLSQTVQHALKECSGATIQKILVGKYITDPTMQGASFTFLKLNQELKQYHV